MFSLTSCFLLSRNKNTENVFSKGNVFLDFLKLNSLPPCFHFTLNEFLISTENEILLFPVFGLFEKICSLKMLSKIQPNAFSSPFSIFSKNENRKQPNQTPPN